MHRDFQNTVAPGFRVSCLHAFGADNVCGLDNAALIQKAHHQAQIIRVRHGKADIQNTLRFGESQRRPGCFHTALSFAFAIGFCKVERRAIQDF